MISLKSVTEEYNLKFIKQDYLNEKSLLALNDVTLEIKQGELVNIIGENGSGKTTLLKVIAGLIDPSKGNVEVKGRVAVIMDLGSSFHPDLTGRENIIASAPLYGLSQSEIIKILPLIEEFAELELFFDAPIRTYSHGMYLRLAFAYALNIDPDILLIDDIITVGDEKARYKCFKKIEELKDSNKTIILVTHDLNFARNFAPKTFWLKDGKIHKKGSSKDIIDEYLSFFSFNKNNKKFSYLLSPRINSDNNNHTLFFRDSNLLSFDNLRINISSHKKTDYFTIIKKEIIEIGNHFIKTVFHFEHNLKILFIFNVEELNIIKFEFFLQSIPFDFNNNLELTLELHWNIFWDDIKTSSPIKYFNNIIFNSWSKNENLSLNGTISPVPIEVKGSDDTQKTSIKVFVPYVKNLKYEHRLLTFKSTITKERLNLESSTQKISKQLKKQTIQNKNNTINCLFCNGIFDMTYKDISLFNFKGIEFIFNYKEKHFSSNQATIEFIKTNNNQNLINYSHHNWPFKINLEITILKTTCNLEVYLIDCAESFILDNFILQILWNNSFLLDDNNSFKGAPLYLMNSKHCAIKISQPDSTQNWLLSHKYKDKHDLALVTYILAKQMKHNKTISCKIYFDDFKKEAEISNINYSTSLIKFKDGKIDIKKDSPFMMPYHYLSLFSSPTWHDSRLCLWQKLDFNIFEGSFPWLPIKIKTKIIEIDINSVEIHYSIIISKKINIEKIQLAFPLNIKEFEVFSSSSFEPYNKKLIINNLSSTKEIENIILFASLSNSNKIYLKNKENGFVINGNMLDKNFLLTIEQIKNKGTYLNFTILCNPIEFTINQIDLGSIKIKKLKEKK